LTTSRSSCRSKLDVDERDELGPMRLDELGDASLGVNGERRGHGRVSTTTPPARGRSCRSSAANVEHRLRARLSVNAR
jgi:hypothetical protein